MNRPTDLRKKKKTSRYEPKGLSCCFFFFNPFRMENEGHCYFGLIQNNTNWHVDCAAMQNKCCSIDMIVKGFDQWIAIDQIKCVYWISFLFYLPKLRLNWTNCTSKSVKEKKKCIKKNANNIPNEMRTAQVTRFNWFVKKLIVKLLNGHSIGSFICEIFKFLFSTILIAFHFNEIQHIRRMNHMSSSLLSHVNVDTMWSSG